MSQLNSGEHRYSLLFIHLEEVRSEKESISLTVFDLVRVHSFLLMSAFKRQAGQDLNFLAKKSKIEIN